jgi:nitrogen regulatory protein P-II 1
MKEIKAYIRPELADRVISELESAGVKGMTVIDVSMIGTWADPEKSKISLEYCDRYSKIVKLELVCEDDEVDKIVQIILANAHTGQKGDGKIFVTDVDEAISIRTKRKGAEAL